LSRIESIRRQVEEATSDYDKEKLQERRQALAERMADRKFKPPLQPARIPVRVASLMFGPSLPGSGGSRPAIRRPTSP
jgi:anti-sigma factor RsiW